MKARFALPLVWLAFALIMAATTVGQTAWLNAASQIYATQDTYFVVAHWHYTLSLVGVCLVMGAVYLALRPIKPWRRRLAWTQTLIFLTGAALIFYPGVLLPVLDPLLRYNDVERVFIAVNWISSFGYALTLLGLAIFLGLLVDAAVRALKRRRTSPA
jgi:cytochrome c oxidase subunit 1